ncbi:MAG: tRNA 2-thiouridine(34) synthase MnmA [Arsenophonus sp.]|nr:MAG: tRNA 2-thiouridine(34) synthase MnmA [Arsenophonus sp.]
MSINCSKKVIVAMSGGVDSSVSAYLLKKQGYQVAGLFMKNWEEDDTEKYCMAANDLADAQSVCDTINIKLYTVNFATEYWNNVFIHFLNEYKIGRTPNPDILCNQEIKFKVFRKFAIQNLSADYIATGHYARIRKINGSYQLLRANDKNKDQSYFLYTLNQKQLEKNIFPIGELKKSEVRYLAENIGLVTAKKKDSTGICFIGKKKFCDFISKYLFSQPGPIVTVDGKILGNHPGIIYYTLGQRKGLGIGGLKEANKNPWYVVDKDIKNNMLIVAQGHNHPRALSKGLIINNIHWITPKIENIKNQYTVKTRYRQKDVPCKIIQFDNRKIAIKFNYPIESVTPGQSAVLYNNEICLGGGVIDERIQNGI